jgi:hypothetical protein
VIIMGAYLGVHLGAWTNFKLGILRGPPLTKPYPIMWPAINQWGLPLLRMVIGGVICVAIRAIFKPLTYFVTCRLMGVDEEGARAKERHQEQAQGRGRDQLQVHHVHDGRVWRAVHRAHRLSGDRMREVNLSHRSLTNFHFVYRRQTMDLPHQLYI